MTFKEKYFESLGGDELMAELKQKGLNPYEGPTLDIKISDLEAYKDYLALGGDDEYVRLGCPQNKEITIDNRVKLIRQKLKVQ